MIKNKMKKKLRLKKGKTEKKCFSMRWWEEPGFKTTQSYWINNIKVSYEEWIKNKKTVWNYEVQYIDD